MHAPSRRRFLLTLECTRHHLNTHVDRQVSSIAAMLCVIVIFGITWLLIATSWEILFGLLISPGVTFMWMTVVWLSYVDSQGWFNSRGVLLLVWFLPLLQAGMQAALHFSEIASFRRQSELKLEFILVCVCVGIGFVGTP